MILILDAKRRLTLPASLAPTRPGDDFKVEPPPRAATTSPSQPAKRKPSGGPD